MIHELKITPERLTNLINGSKKAEVRLNDRDYQTGEILEFSQHNPMRELFSGGYGCEVYFRITHIHSGLGLEPGYVVLSVERTEKP